MATDKNTEETGAAKPKADLPHVESPSISPAEPNKPERERLKRSIADVLLGEVSLQKLMTSRMRQPKPKPHSLKAPRVTIDNESSGHSTILEILAGDRTGLLYSIASVLSDHECNIEVALIDTQGNVAIDVFYVTRDGAKLDALQQQELKSSLLEELAD